MDFGLVKAFPFNTLKVFKEVLTSKFWVLCFVKVFFAKMGQPQPLLNLISFLCSTVQKISGQQDLNSDLQSKRQEC